MQTCVRYLLLFADPQHFITEDTLPDYPLSLYAAADCCRYLQFCYDECDKEVLLPSIMHLLEDGSSQHAAFYQLLYYWPGEDDHPSRWEQTIPPAVYTCVDIGFIEGVRFLLMKDNTCVNQATLDGMTSLHLASRRGYLDIVQLLLEHNASVDQATKDGETALQLVWRNSDMFRLLLDKGANPNANGANLIIPWRYTTDMVPAGGEYGTALQQASKYGHDEIAILLLERGADPNTQGASFAIPRIYY
jgi:hypothetical protein